MTPQEHAEKFPLSYTAFKLESRKQERVMVGSESFEDALAYEAGDYLAWFLKKSQLEQKLAEAEKKLAEANKWLNVSRELNGNLDQKLSEALEVIRFYGDRKNWNGSNLLKDDIDKLEDSSFSEGGKRARDLLKKHEVGNEN
jgi:hypothetical protein